MHSGEPLVSLTIYKKNKKIQINDFYFLFFGKNTVSLENKEKKKEATNINKQNHETLQTLQRILVPV